ncbi:PREDICTED: palmitoyl-monogalactosyldiacylglycerol [Prunus dulcis]|uniref:PREDICTED: palmitoyl-monogalactosyldiacylglycerol n=1 Tax=Prunus dulcis TaxID=3755 RepID=A0A5E4EQ37_PRUDU|nr:palmitoyl-monogalactosyldiacylglycerol delta-7 desaturase, chloroplastic-like [Prunus dulcis]VVA17536.1 PREDICTED: palmitoyl-monogalactosyldiacylglycerol [Prunus dulcis]
MDMEKKEKEQAEVVPTLEWYFWLAKWRIQLFGRQWNFFDVASVIVVSVLHCLALLAPFHFNWGAVWVAMALNSISGVGITLSYHRNLTHKSFKLPKWLEYFFAYCAVLGLQGSPLEWVSTHRNHHQFTDTWSDPHSPIAKGLWFSHIGWVFDYRSRFGSYEGRLNNVGDLKKQPYYIFLHYTYPFHSVALGVLLYVVGGLPFLVWGMGVRMVYMFHVTFSINSICHTWGTQVWDTGDSSRNNWLFGLLAHGEGWHNNHHAFDYSARQGLEWWQIDTTWYLIRFLQALGLATEVKLPTEAQKKRKALCNKVINKKEKLGTVGNNGKLQAVK